MGHYGQYYSGNSRNTDIKGKEREKNYLHTISGRNLRLNFCPLRKHQNKEGRALKGLWREWTGLLGPDRLLVLLVSHNDDLLGFSLWHKKGFWKRKYPASLFCVANGLVGGRGQTGETTERQLKWVLVTVHSNHGHSYNCGWECSEPGLWQDVGVRFPSWTSRWKSRHPAACVLTIPANQYKRKLQTIQTRMQTPKYQQQMTGNITSCIMKDKNTAHWFPLSVVPAAAAAGCPSPPPPGRSSGWSLQLANQEMRTVYQWPHIWQTSLSQSRRRGADALEFNLYS